MILSSSLQSNHYWHSSNALFPQFSSSSATYSTVTSEDEHSTQSSRISGDTDSNNTAEDLLDDLQGRVTMVPEMYLGHIFPDSEFGFAVNEAFINNFSDSFLTKSCLINGDHFSDDQATSIFLNRMVSTIAELLRSKNNPYLNHITPLRYFVSENSPVPGSSVKQKPGLMLVRLLDGCTVHQSPLFWHHAQGFIGQTREYKAPIKMTEGIVTKSYLTFCDQPERDSIINICISGEGFRIIVMDHAGSIETNPIPFESTYGTSSFLRTIMALAFFPDRLLGIDTTIIRRDTRSCSNKIFENEYPPYPRNTKTSVVNVIQPSYDRLPNTDPVAITTSSPPPDSNSMISSVLVGSTTYPVVSVLFDSKNLIGRSTKVFLVDLPDGKRGIVKDSWITTDKTQEAVFLEGLDVPFGPSIRDRITLACTDALRPFFCKRATRYKPREKRRIVEYPAGIPISDFTSLWELMAAFLDITVAILYLESKNKIHRDISYPNVLLREPGQDSGEKERIKERLQTQLDLSDIVSLREELKCREGLLIDFDHATELDPTGNRDQGSPHYAVNSSGVTGTVPFIAIELLLDAVPHRVIHDVESLFSVLLFICSHLDGPCNSIRHPTIYGAEGRKSHPSPIRLWFSNNNLVSLGHVKGSIMFLFFETQVLPNISPYFRPLIPHLKRLWGVLHPQRTEHMMLIGEQSCHSTTNVRDIIEVFKLALYDPVLIELARASKTSTLGKRAYPGDLVSTSTGRDATKRRNLGQT